MQLTMSGEYAVRAMLHLSAQPFGTVVQISEVAKEWNIPENFLRKITALLSKAELITSTRGINGGIRLSRPAETLSILDVIEAVEGKMLLNRCLICEQVCARDSWCAVHLLWEEAQQQLRSVLASKNMAELAVLSLDRRAALDDARRPETLT